MMNFVCKLIFLGVVFISSTLRFKVIGKPYKGRAIYTFWHNNFFPLVYPFRRLDIALFVSAHADGEYLAQTAKSLGYEVIRGSSRGASALKGTLKLLKLSTSSIAFATDGPRGPRHVVKIGIIKIAELSGLPIVPAGVGISKCIELKTWDRFQLPMLFAKCVINIGEPFFVDKCDEEKRLQLENALNKVNKDASDLAN